MTKKIKLSNSKARIIALNCQLLSRGRNNNNNQTSLIQIFDQLGYIQIDTISVVQRAHHMTLWTRFNHYRPEMIDKLQRENKNIFEYWAHAASLIPIKDYRFYLPKMKKYQGPHSKWEKNRLEKFGHMMPSVLKRIKAEGPLCSRDFISDEQKKGGSWWDWRPTKVALELLFWQGKLMVAYRKNFSRYYDLTERVLPDNINQSFPSDTEQGRFLIKRALTAHGFANIKEIREHIRGYDKKMLKHTLNEMVNSNELQLIQLENSKDEENYMLSSSMDKLLKLKKTNPNIHFLSPFDNLIIQRERTKRIFDFDYTLECYLPEQKRKFGYFVLPILFGNNFIGRLDAKAFRKEKVLQIKSLYFEPDIKTIDSFLPNLSAKIKDFAEFNGCDTIKLDKIKPAKFKKEINRFFK